MPCRHEVVTQVSDNSLASGREFEMAEAIALVGCRSPAQETEYLHTLTAAMPEEQLIPFRLMAADRFQPKVPGL